MTQLRLRNARSTDPTVVDRPGSDRTSTSVENGRRSGSFRVWAVGGGLAVIAIGAGAAYAMSRSPGEPSPAASVAGRVGGADLVLGSGTAGVFAVRVTGTECGLAAVGPGALRQPAKGQYCLVSLSVKNNGGQPALLDGGAQQAVDAAGRAYPVADRAAVFLNDQQPSLLDEVGPGATVRGVLPFDVPAGTSLSALMVRDSMGGVAVRVPFS